MNIKYGIKIIFFLILCVIVYPKGYYVLKNNPLFIAPVEKPYVPDSIGVFVINLDRSKERYAYVMKSIDPLNLPVKRISAVDGKKLLDAKIKEMVDEKAFITAIGYAPKRGTIGCSLSHIDAWVTFLESDFEFALICEDDICFDPVQVKDILNKALDQRKHWDVLNLETKERGMPLTVKALDQNHSIVNYVIESNHSGAYLIHRGAALKLLQKALPIVMPIDHYFTRSWELGLRFSGVHPLVIHQGYGDSEIEGGQALVDKPKKHRSIAHSLYILHSDVMRVLYNLYLTMKERV